MAIDSAVSPSTTSNLTSVALRARRDRSGPRPGPPDEIGDEGQLEGARILRRVVDDRLADQRPEDGQRGDQDDGGQDDDEQEPAGPGRPGRCRRDPRWSSDPARCGGRRPVAGRRRPGVVIVVDRDRHPGDGPGERPDSRNPRPGLRRRAGSRRLESSRARPGPGVELVLEDDRGCLAVDPGPMGRPLGGAGRSARPAALHRTDPALGDVAGQPLVPEVDRDAREQRRIGATQARVIATCGALAAVWPRAAGPRSARRRRARR